MKKQDLIIGKVYLCTDNMVRKLIDIDDELFYYSIAIDRVKGEYIFAGEYKTWVNQIEDEFLYGRILS